MRWSESGDVAIGADRGCVIVEVRNVSNDANECVRASNDGLTTDGCGE